MNYKIMICLRLRLISKLDFESTQFQTTELIPRLQFEHQALKNTDTKKAKKGRQISHCVRVLVCLNALDFSSSLAEFKNRAFYYPQ